MQTILVRHVFLRQDLEPIEVVQLSNGSKGATVRSLCRLLDLSRQGQVRRIQRTPKLAEALIQVSMATAAGPRLFDVLLDRVIPIWVLGISEAHLAPHKQELVALIKEHAVEAIERAFSGDAPENPAEAPPMDNTLRQPQEGQGIIVLDIGPVSPADNWQQMGAGLGTMAQGLGQVQMAVTRQAALERAQRVEATLDMMPERIAHLYAMARARKAVTSIPITDTLAALARQFGVEEVGDIPAAQWPEVVATLEGYMRQDMQAALEGQLVAPDITPERLAALRAMPYEEYLRTPEWRARRQEALKRAQYRCQLCNTNQSPLEVHHRTYERLGAEVPEDLFVLCYSCHQWYHRKPDAPGRQA